MNIEYSHKNMILLMDIDYFFINIVTCNILLIEMSVHVLHMIWFDWSNGLIMLLITIYIHIDLKPQFILSWCISQHLSLKINLKINRLGKFSYDTFNFSASRKYWKWSVTIDGYWILIWTTNPIKFLMRARGEKSLALPPKLFSFGLPHS